MTDRSQKRAELEAASLFDEYLQACLSGKQPHGEELLLRCPQQSRDELRMAIDGADAYFTYVFPRLARPRVVRETISAMQAARRKKIWLGEVREKASTVWRLDPSDTTASVASLIGVNVATRPQLESYNSAAVPLVFNRIGAGNTASAKLVDKAWRRVREQSLPLRAQELLDDLMIDQAPVDLHAVAERMYIHVQEETFEGPEGCLVTDGHAGAILINTVVERLRRRRFTFAHEIAHFVLHKDKQAFRDTRQELSDYTNSTVEIEANIFASMLLMPMGMLPKGFGKERPTLSQADELARKFDVSLEAALRRLVGQSNWRCAFVVSRDGVIQRWTPSLLFDGYITVGRQPHPKTMARMLLETSGPDEDGMILPPSAWVEGASSDDDVLLREESRRLDSGYVYSLISFLDPD